MLSGKTILICGANGKSGRAAAELVLSLGARVVLSDAKPAMGAPPAGAPEMLEDFRGRPEAELIDEVDPQMVLTAPGVPLSGEVFERARNKNIPIHGESDFAAGILAGKERPPFLIGITGTDGKSTTTALLAHLISNATRLTAVPCGNYGLPLSTLALNWERESADVLVVECSSFQLEPTRDFHPAIAMVLNLARDHLDRYPDMSAYLRAKLRIAENQTPDDLFLAPDSILSAMHRLPEMVSLKPRVRVPDPAEAEGGAISFRGEPLDLADFPPAGLHNRLNLLFALTALEDLLERRSGAGAGEPEDAANTDAYLGRDALTNALRTFHGLPHRLEHVARLDGIEYVNDSKATTVQAMLTAIKAYRTDSDCRVYLLCGGRDKDGDFSILPFGDDSIRFLPFGEAGPKIARAGSAAGTEPTVLSDLKIAFKAARESAELDGKTDSRKAVVLLSPGCASFDAYGSYEKRGEHFKELVGEIRESPS